MEYLKKGHIGCFKVVVTKAWRIFFCENKGNISREHRVCKCFVLEIQDVLQFKLKNTNLLFILFLIITKYAQDILTRFW